MFGRGSYFGVNGAEIDVPAALADVVGVADGASELRPLAADITYSCHNSLVPSRLMPRVLLNFHFIGICGIWPDWRKRKVPPLRR